MSRWLNFSLIYLLTAVGLEAQNVEIPEAYGEAYYLQGNDESGFPNILSVARINPDGSVSLSRPSGIIERRSIGLSSVNDLYIWIGRVSELFTSDSHASYRFYSARGGSTSLEMAKAEISGEYLILKLANLPSEEIYGNTGTFVLELSYDAGSPNLGYRFGSSLIFSRYDPPITNVNNALDSPNQGDSRGDSPLAVSNVPEIDTLGTSLAGGCGLIEWKNQEASWRVILILLALLVLGMKLRTSKSQRSRLS